MNEILNYSVLRYRNSFASGEILNLGILIYDEKSTEFKFIFPNRLSNIGSLYVNFDTHFLKNILKSFEQKAKSLSDDSRINGLQLYKKEGLNSLIEEFFYVKDSSSLYFADSQSLLYKDKLKAIDFLIKKFVPHLYSTEQHTRIDEQRIQNKFWSTFEHKSNILKRDLQLLNDVQIKGAFFEENFHYAWKNGRTNLIQPLSFDLSSSERIKNKSCQWYAILKDLSEGPSNESYNFDLLISKPRQNSLLKDFKKAIEFLTESTSQLRLKEYDKIDSYVDEILAEGHG